MIELDTPWFGQWIPQKSQILRKDPITSMTVTDGRWVTVHRTSRSRTYNKTSAATRMRMERTALLLGWTLEQDGYERQTEDFFDTVSIDVFLPPVEWKHVST